MSHPLAAFGWDDRLVALAAGLPPDLQPGRVTRVDRGRSSVATALGERRPHTQHPVVVGDWVALSADGERVVEVLPRRSALVRRAAGEPTGAQTLAANIDHVLVVHGLDRGVNRRRLERELVLAWDSGAVPIVVLTKTDLSRDVAAEVEAAESAALGVDVVAVSAADGAGLDRLRDLVGPGRTFLLVGASGVGKSTLVNALASQERQSVGAVRDSDGRGRHTTTAAELVVLAGGPILIDTPGIRSVGLWDDGEGMASAFVDVEELALSCRFPDCAHDREPGCAVRAGVDGERLRSWQKLRRELDRTAGDRAGWERAAASKKLRARARSYKGQSRP